MALLLDLLVSGQTRLNDDTYAKNIYADKFIRTGSSDLYVLLGGGGHKLLSDFSMAHSHPYLPTTQVSQEQASNDDWIRTHALSTLRGHVYNTSLDITIIMLAVMLPLLYLINQEVIILV